MLQNSVAFLCETLASSFYARTVVEKRKRNITTDVKLVINKKEREVELEFSNKEEKHLVTFPVPFERNGVLLISNNGIERSVCNYFDVSAEKEKDLLSIFWEILFGNPSGIISDSLLKKGPYIQQIVYGFDSGNASTVLYNLQKAINEVVNYMPLHETDMNSWVMNSRLILIDPLFDELIDPKDRLDYQVEKNRKYFSRGWTSIGLSDGSLSDQNYILKYDIRHLTPFGLGHHNPQRNLYSTLGMKGDETPRVLSQSAANLAAKGLTRKGWNLFTAFVDIPDVFEDQIMVDEFHASKFIKSVRKVSCFGDLLVAVGDKLREGSILSHTSDGEKQIFDVVADEAVVTSVEEVEINVGGAAVKAHNLLIEIRRYLKDGTKITNMHGNKGVIRLRKLGHAVDPRTGMKRRIDIIVSAKSIRKRKNFGQLLEGLLNELQADKKYVVADDAVADIPKLEGLLETCGLQKDGTMEVSTYAGNFRCVCGTVFWGVTKDAEDQIWDETDTVRRNGRDLRVAGLKFSTVEFRSLITRFGKDNPILEEILSYVQGSEDLHEQIKILESVKGILPKGVPVIDVKDVRVLNQTNGTLFPKTSIEGTIVDEFFMPNGFYLRLPLPYSITMNDKLEVVTEGLPQTQLPNGASKVFSTNTIYIPAGSLRKCWRHETGNFGLSDLGVLINYVAKAAQAYLADPENAIRLRLFYSAVRSYFYRVALRMCTKKGEISTYGMSVRYPFSAKAVATLSNELPKNTVEISRSMAKRLNVHTGDVVLAERFPCLGFMSIRPQKVQVTDDPGCKFTIRVSGNSLGSMSLDFDGDVLFLASFHTPKAKEMLKKEWQNPNKSCYDVIKELNKKAGAPHSSSLALGDYDLSAFAKLDVDSHAVLVKRATGVKSHTGPVIALAYNIMRILENSDIKDNQKTNVAVEVFLDRVGNSVFKQKHGVKSLHDIVIDAICSGDVDVLVENGFAKGTSTVICDVIRAKALQLGVRDLRSYHAWILKNKRSKIINRIVREQNKIYFASRSSLPPLALLAHLDSKEVDWPSRMVKRVLSGKANRVENELEKLTLSRISNTELRKSCSTMWDYMKTVFALDEKPDKRPLSNISPRESRRLLGEAFNETGRSCIRQ